eukprot:SAG11_NODE_1259_length_5357_cov_34.538227_1_plen_229_part_00
MVHGVRCQQWAVRSSTAISAAGARLSITLPMEELSAQERAELFALRAENRLLRASAQLSPIVDAAAVDSDGSIAVSNAGGAAPSSTRRAARRPAVRLGLLGYGAINSVVTDGLARGLGGNAVVAAVLVQRERPLPPELPAGTVFTADADAFFAAECACASPWQPSVFVQPSSPPWHPDSPQTSGLSHAWLIPTAGKSASRARGSRLCTRSLNDAWRAAAISSSLRSAP